MFNLIKIMKKLLDTSGNTGDGNGILDHVDKKYVIGFAVTALTGLAISYLALRS